MKKITSAQWKKIEGHPLNSYARVCYYDSDKNQVVEVARWRNTYGPSTYANFGMLNVWSILFTFHAFESQGGCNVAGGYNKPIANLESCLYQFLFVQTHSLA